MHLSCPFVLASQSPRRVHLLNMMGLAFEQHPADIEEVVEHGLAPEAVVRSLARQKAEAVAAVRPDALVLGADTIVVLDGEILGKPDDPAHARALLRRLSGRTNTVYTGLALAHPATDRLETTFRATDVTFSDLSDAEIAAYVATGSPLDKAGAYGSQDDRGALFIERYEGDFYTVVGLPVNALYHFLRDRFGDLFTP